MTFRVGDRVRITGSAPGTGNFSDQSAAVGYTLFGAIPSIVNGDTVPYTAWDGAANWELGHAVFNTGAPATLTRTPIRSSNANALVNFTGTVYIWCDALAEDLILGTPTGTGNPVLATSPTVSGNWLMNQQSAKYTAVAASTVATTIDLSLTPFYDVAMTSSTTFTLSNCPNNANYVYQFFMRIKQDATGGRVPTFPASVHFPGGVMPTPTTTANQSDLWALMTFNGGTTYMAFLVAPNVTP